MKLFKVASLGTALALASFSSLSAQNNEGDVLIHSQGCRLVGGLAETVMGERQKDVPISEMMKRIQGSVAIIGFDTLPIDENSLARMVLLAYETPRYNSSELQQDAVSGFRNAVERQCYNQLLEDG